MTPKQLLKEIRKDNREEAKNFITGRPPHPDEIRKTQETRRFPCQTSSQFHSITITKRLTPQETHVEQTIRATGNTLTEKGQEKEDLGEWGADEFAFQIQYEPEKETNIPMK